jgi:putative membrane protein
MTSPSEEGAVSRPDPSGEAPPPGPSGPRGPLEGESTRLHPAVLAVWAARSAFSLVILLLVAGIVGVVALGIFLALLLGMGIRYLRFRWRLDPDAVVIEEGFFVRKRRVIRRERIQSVDLERGILHRLLGVVEVRIEAIGGAGTEGKLAAVDPTLAESLRRILLARGRPGPSPSAPETSARGPALLDAESPAPELQAHPPEPPERVLASVSPEGLVLAGLTGGRVGVVAALVGFFFQTVPDAWWAETVGRLIQQAPDPTTVVGMRVLVILALFALLVGFFLSVVATVFAHWDFTLSAGEETLGVRRGLFTQHRDTVPFRRIQAVRIEENPVRRLLRRGALRAVVAGRAGMQADEATDLLLPIGHRDELHRLARGVVGLEGEGPVVLNPMPGRARRRRMTRAVLGSLLGGALAALVGSLAWDLSPLATGGWAFGVLLPPALLLAEGAYRSLGWADLSTHVVVREGVLNRRTTLVPVDRLQVLEITATPFQRVAGLATLHLRVARPLMGATPRALDLSRTHGADWQEALAGRMNVRRPRAASPRGASGARFR